MSTQHTSSQSTKERVARTVDQMLIRLAVISPLALLALLTSELAREYGELLIVLGIFAAFVWVKIDRHRR